MVSIRTIFIGYVASTMTMSVTINTLLFWIICCYTLFSSSALAGNVYIKADLGYSMLDDEEVTITLVQDSWTEQGMIDYEGGLFTSAAIGYDFGPVRVDGEFGYSSNDVDIGDMKGESVSNVEEMNIHQLCFMANAYFDLENPTVFTPYMGAGMGFSRMMYEEGGYDSDDTVAAYQFSLGLLMKVQELVILDFSYRYFNASDLMFDYIYGSTLELDYSSQVIMAGVRYDFE